MGTRDATTRRSFLAVAGLAAAGLAVDAYAGHRPQRAVGRLVRTAGGLQERPRDGAREGSRPDSRPAAVRLLAAPATVDLGGRTASTWTFNGELPGPELRLRVGEVLRARLENRLPAATTVHWHGIALDNRMDGVPGLTQSAVAPGQGFDYEFSVPDPGTYFYHPHVGLQIERGLYGPLVVEDPGEVVHYDHEAVLILDDWTDAVGPSPEAILANLQRGGMRHASQAGGMHHGHHGAGAAATFDPTSPLGADAGDVRHPLYLVNGRSPRSPTVLRGRPGERIRLRIVNTAADTAFRLAVGGHRLKVTHADGFPIRPVTGDALLIAMGERYDLQVELGDGVFPLVALAEGKDAQAFAVVRTSLGATPRANVRPAELDRWVVTVADLDAAGAVDLGRRPVSRTHRLVLDGNMATYRWTINGHAHHGAAPLAARQGERVRLVFENRSAMFHPMHLHGHTFQVRRAGERRPGPRKDTIIVRPLERVTVEFDADNPGRWMLHCHNAYHQAGGMMTTLAYEP
ncbi:MAG TPA: multicopper oxidase family protein [Actinomycetota bacterium]|nr:multicopper oxidase family protein [Actinomycetota bacterium]